MTKRLWALCSIALLVFLFVGINQTVLTAETEGSGITPHCETIDEETKNEVEMILDIFYAEDIDALTDRLNELSTSTALLEDEMDVLKMAICVGDVYWDNDLHAAINVYHSLVTFSHQMEENIHFEELIFTPLDNTRYMHVEGVLQDMDASVFVDHYYSFRATETLRDQERLLEEERAQEIEDTPLIVTIAEDMVTNTYDIFQNPLEKLMGKIDSFFTEEAEEETERFELNTRINSDYFNAAFSLISFEEHKWEPVNMVEYYPSTSTVPTIERLQEVHAELPDYWYPKEEIEQADWNGFIAYYEERRLDLYEYDVELYEYIFGSTERDSRYFEEMIRRVKREHHIE